MGASTLTSDIRTHHRICPFCEQNCATEVTVDHATRRVIDVRGDKADPLSKGFICPKVTAVKDMHHDPDVLKSPVIKRNGVFEPVGWDEALDFAADRIREIQGEHGRDALAFFFGTTIAHVPALALYTGSLLATLQTGSIFSLWSMGCHPQLPAALTMFAVC